MLQCIPSCMVKLIMSCYVVRRVYKTEESIVESPWITRDRERP